MSKDRNFHKLIEEQDKEKKNLVWRKIQNQIADGEDDLNIQNYGEVAALSKSNTKIRLILISATVFLALAVVIFLVIFFNYNQNNEDFIKNPNDEFRYCTVNDYYLEVTNENLKQYKEKNNLNLLYFDFYDVTEYFADTQYKLNDTNEVICLYEEIYDENFAFINLFITDNKTDLDAVKFIINASNKQTEINSVNINYGVDLNIICANFEYGGYKYYLSVDYEQSEEQYLLNLLTQLLQ